MDIQFPEGFVWGTASAAHQVEGNNSNNDCWLLEHARPSLFWEPSGDAIDQYHRFADDVAILSGLGVQAYRFSIEWARIEPEEGHFSQAALDHYQRCIDACLARGVAPVLTFHHFTQPVWQARNGGMTDDDFPDRFARYCERAAGALTGFRTACTINELNLPIVTRPMLLRLAETEKGAQRLAAAEAALGGPIGAFFLYTPREAILTNGLAAHAKARDAIKAAHPNARVGITLSIQDEVGEPGAEDIAAQAREDYYGHCLDAVKGDDFIGVQTYNRNVHRADGTSGAEPGHPLTPMGYEDRPQALAEVCRFVWERTKTPILVTENGISSEDDARRCAFIKEALTDLRRAMDDGVDIGGYFYWSCFDNFEWLYGYSQKFGLVAVDRASQRRQIKSSAVLFGDIARANGF